MYTDLLFQNDHLMPNNFIHEYRRVLFKFLLLKELSGLSAHVAQLVTGSIPALYPEALLLDLLLAVSVPVPLAS